MACGCNALWGIDMGQGVKLPVEQHCLGGPVHMIFTRLLVYRQNTERHTRFLTAELGLKEDREAYFPHN